MALELAVLAIALFLLKNEAMRQCFALTVAE